MNFNKFLLVLFSVSLVSLALFEPSLLEASDASVTLQTSVQTYLSVSLDSNTVDMGNLQPGTPVTGESTITVTTNNSSGYQIQVKRDNSDYTFKKGTDYISDKTVWDPTGDGNASVWSGTGLGFRIKQTETTSNCNSTWWGSDDTNANAKFTGLPSSNKQIMNFTTYSASSTVTKVSYKVDVPNSQATGAYSGGITFSVTAN